MMGGENQDPTAVHSSIALLQERFRQLQRAKQMREERELLKMLNEPKQLNSNIPSTNTYEPARLSLEPESVIPSKSPPHVSLSLGPTSQARQQEHRSLETMTASRGLRAMDYTHSSLQAAWKNVYDCDSENDSGVDTSLHL